MVRLIQKTISYITACALMFAALSACNTVHKPNFPEQITSPPFDLTAAPVQGADGLARRDYQSWISANAALTEFVSVNDDKLAQTKTGDLHIYGGVSAPWIRSLVAAYRTTLDIKFIKAASILCENMYQRLADTDKNGFLRWEYDGTADEYCLDTGSVVRAFSEFASVVDADSLLTITEAPCGKKYGQQAGRLMTAVKSHLLPSCDEYFQPALCLYTEKQPVTSLPHSHNLSMAAALYAASLAIPDSADLYVARADAIMRIFRDYLKTSGDGSYIFNKKDDVLHGYYLESEPAGAQELSLAAAAMYGAYAHGSVFGREELAVMAQTLRAQNVTTPDALALAAFNPYIWMDCEAAATGENAKPDQGMGLMLSLHPEASAPASFPLSFPINGALETGTSAVFSWEPSLNAADYMFELCADIDFASAVVQRPYVRESSVYINGLATGKTYYWRVTARSASGRTQSSEVFSFTTAAKTKYEKKTVSFDYKTVVGEFGECRVEVYVNGVPVYQKRAADGGWHSLTLDISSVAQYDDGVALTVRLASQKPGTGSAVIYIDNIRTDDFQPEGFEENADGFIPRFMPEADAKVSSAIRTGEDYKTGASSYSLKLVSQNKVSPCFGEMRTYIIRAVPTDENAE